MEDDILHCTVHGTDERAEIANISQIHGRRMELNGGSKRNIKFHWLLERKINVINATASRGNEHSAPRSSPVPFAPWLLCEL